MSLASAQEIDGCRAGFDGKFKVGLWTPLLVTLEGGEKDSVGELSVEIADGDDVTSRYSRRVALPSGERRSELFHVRFGSRKSSLSVRFVPEAGGPVVRVFEHLDPALRREGRRRSRGMNESPKARFVPPAMFSTQQLVVSLGPATGLSQALGLNRLPPEEQVALARLDQPDELRALPTRWFGYEGVDALAISTSGGSEFYRELTADHWRAIDEWVQAGGRLILFAGAAERLNDVLDSIQGEAGKKFATLLPGAAPQKDEALYRASELEKYIGGTATIALPRLNAGDEFSRRGFRAPLLTGVRGAVELTEGIQRVPLVVRAASGFGEVVFAAFDPDQPPLYGWSGRPRFLNRLLGHPPQGIRRQREQSEQKPSQAGLVDLSGQLRGALDQFEGVRFAPFLVIALLGMVYVALIGPLDYWLVRKVLRRPELTWVTFPAAMLLISLGAYWLSHWMKGDRLRVNQVEVVDVDVNSGWVRGQTWFNVFSPRTDGYDVEVQPEGPIANPSHNPPAASTVVAWHGLPGGALGGMARRGATAVFQGHYSVSDEGRAMSGVPLQVWSTKSFTARWLERRTGPAGVEISLRKDRLDDPDGVAVVNNLGFSLKNCLIAYGRRAATLDELPPGKHFIEFDVSSLEDLLTGRHFVRDEDKKDQRRLAVRHYDPSSVDVPAVLQQMMFYRASGGKKYSGLLNQHQHFVDLSRQLERDRGLLVGYADRAATRLTLNGQTAGDGEQDRRWTCYRFVFDGKE